MIFSEHVIFEKLSFLGAEIGALASATEKLLGCSILGGYVSAHSKTHSIGSTRVLSGSGILLAQVPLLSSSLFRIVVFSYHAPEQ